MTLTLNEGVSFEFFPPNSDLGEQGLWRSINELALLEPDFVSVTYGAGGSTRDRTIRVTKRIKDETKLLAVAHLTCVGASKTELIDIINSFKSAGIDSLMALRGDPPGGVDSKWTPHPEGLNYAVELVALAKEHGITNIGVAAFPDKHPESPSKGFDTEILKAKQDAGASFAITQLFFDQGAYLDLVESASNAGVKIPIRPGIMPLTELRQLAKFSQLAGAPMPNKVLEFFQAAGDDEIEVAKRGIEFATELAQNLLEAGAPGIHLYTMNKSNAAKQVCLNLRS